ncbi:leucine-rich repeat flightless-interacting protein 2 isoform X13 [Rattus norvegicus]|uniref:leucine-rich repeat flightless-interacting protein 2 isoform X13 n=1 Tax=Rattus norvegicus TaxID=10116 RepID=UPI001916D311|nr:leucine-rich repeat flightless-interacting protein 2 isoform X29 [Rattus norvegicus]
MGTPGSGRKRTPVKDRFSAEDEALSNIAREAEARLAAKRAARAEARDIRMRELERQQREPSHHSFDRKWGEIHKWLEDSERAQYSHRSGYRSGYRRSYLGVEDTLSLRSLGSHRSSSKDITGTHWSRASTPKRRDMMLDEKSDKQYAENYTRPSSRNSASATTPLSGNSSRRGSGDTSSLIDPDTSLSELRDIYDLKDQIHDVEGRYMQGLKELKESLSEVEEKYKKAMVSNAQLDNEKNNLIYQVDTLKDVIEEQEEQMAEFYRENEEKSKELERQKHMCSVLQHKMDELKEGLRQRDELIEENQRLQQKVDTMTKEVFDLQETLLWKDKTIGALEKQKEHIACLRNERDVLREELADLQQTVKTAEKHGLVIIPESTPNGDVNHEPVVGAITAVSQEAAQVLESAGEGPLDVRLRKLAEEKDELLSQIRKLKLQLEEERQKCSRNDGMSGDLAGLQNGSDLQFIEMQRDANRQISEYKFKLSKAEQDIATLEQSISRLEGQVLRYKTAAENAEKIEDELKAEKRKLQRELRTAQDKIEEMEMTNSHLAKRLEKMKANRTALLAQQ